MPADSNDHNLTQWQAINFRENPFLFHRNFPNYMIVRIIGFVNLHKTSKLLSDRLYRADCCDPPLLTEKEKVEPF